MRCIVRNLEELDLNHWGILARLSYKKDVDVLYLINKFRTPEQEQIFLVGYQSQAGQKKNSEN